MKIFKVVVVDDHTLFRQGLVAYVNSLHYCKVVHEAADGTELIQFMKTTPVDLVFMDLKMPQMSGIEATREALKIQPEVKIITLTMADDEHSFNMMTAAGAHGYLLKSSDSEEIKQAVQVVTKGGNYFSDDVIISIANTREKEAQPLAEALTSRELDILELICRGLTNQEIGDKLHISPRTVDGHKANLLLKTGQKNSVSLVVYAIRKKLIEIK